MSLRWWLRPPRRLLALFLTVTLVPAGALVWLSWRLLEQDRALASQRLQERLDHKANLIAAELDRHLSEIEDELPTWAASARDDDLDDAVIVTFSHEGVDAKPALRLLYHPWVPSGQESRHRMFQAGEVLEFQRRDFRRAIFAFRELAGSEDPAIRAGALVRLGRVLRKNDEHQEALTVYEDLARMGSTPVAGVPAELLARHARCRTLEELGRLSDLPSTADALYRDLQSGRWRLQRATYSFHSEEARRWLGRQAPSEPPDGLALAAAVEWLWDQWQESRASEANGRGRTSFWSHGRSILLVWQRTPERLVGLVAGARYLGSQWSGTWEEKGVVVTLTDADGHLLLGQQAAVTAAPRAIRLASENGLPWNLRVAAAQRSPDLLELTARRPLLLAGLSMMVVLVVGGVYFVTRAVTRELAVARLQADFVSAVSHEFRTPLTSMRHLAELLEDGVVTDETRRREYYTVLRREAERLHRLVESLLDFRRMEAEAFEYRFEPLDPGVLVEAVVSEFQRDLAAGDHRIELQADDSLPPVRGDREALGRALWNLLDNAVKYSPDDPAIRVELAAHGNRVAIGVSDRGIGVSKTEQREIFHKFVRGSSPEASGVMGAGMGLAMVHNIVTAHGGEVRLESEPGQGSTFTLLLPVGEKPL